jgi:hypothetical protein
MDIRGFVKGEEGWCGGKSDAFEGEREEESERKGEEASGKEKGRNWGRRGRKERKSRPTALLYGDSRDLLYVSQLTRSASNSKVIIQSIQKAKDVLLRRC